MGNGDDNEAVKTEMEANEPKRSGWAELFTTEDYWAIWLGFFLIVIGMLFFLPHPPKGMRQAIEQANATMQEQADAAPFKTVAWHQANDQKAGIKSTSMTFARRLAKYLHKPHKWKTNPLDSFYVSAPQAQIARDKAQAKYDTAKTQTDLHLAAALKAEDAARTAEFKNTALNEKAGLAIDQWRKARRSLSGAKKSLRAAEPFNQVGYLIALCVLMAVFFGVGLKCMGESFGKFVAGFPFVFVLAVLSYLFAHQSNINAAGIGYAAWAIVFGLLISNTLGTPRWVKPAVQTEYFIKTGLVLLGAEILFGKIVSIGIPGMFVAWAVTPIVLISTYIVGNRFIKMESKTLNITISAAVSVCGVSAAIATAAACRAKKEELTLAVGMSLIFTALMMIGMPYFIRATGMPYILGGAWMGGTIDSTGAVAAAGAFLSDQALHVAATIKMIQNVLIGLVAFCVAIYWCLKVDRKAGVRVGAMEIWYRFPKFVIGFAAASIFFSLIYGILGSDVGNVLIDNGVIRGFTKGLRGWFFCLAFVSIGLATDFRALAHYFKGGKPLWLYIFGQTFNLVLTLLMAYIMFYMIFVSITENI